MKMAGKYGHVLTSFTGPFKEISDQILKGISETTSDKIKNTTTNNLSNYVFIFDDLERISDTLSIKEVFGYINSKPPIKQRIQINSTSLLRYMYQIKEVFFYAATKINHYPRYITI